MFFEFHEQLPPNYAEMGAGNHIAINVETEEDLQAARKRLIAQEASAGWEP